MSYNKLKLEQRLNTNIQSPLFTKGACSLIKVACKHDREKERQKILNKIDKLYKLGAGDWRVWNICGCHATRPNTNAFCTNINHWFAYDNDKNKDERSQLRSLYEKGLITDLPTEQKRVQTMLENESLNTTFKVTCQDCGREVSQLRFEYHQSKCKMRALALEKAKNHEHTIAQIKNSDTETLKEMITQMIDISLNKQFKNKELVKEVSAKYREGIEAAFTNSVEKAELLEDEIKHLQGHNTILTERIKSMKNVFNHAQKIFVSPDMASVLEET